MCVQFWDIFNPTSKNPPLRAQTSMLLLSSLLILQGDGDYELVKDIEFDDYLWKRIKKVFLPFHQQSFVVLNTSNCRSFSLFATVEGIMRNSCFIIK